MSRKRHLDTDFAVIRKQVIKELNSGHTQLETFVSVCRQNDYYPINNKELKKVGECFQTCDYVGIGAYFNTANEHSAIFSAIVEEHQYMRTCIASYFLNRPSAKHCYRHVVRFLNSRTLVVAILKDTSFEAIELFDLVKCERK